LRSGRSIGAQLIGDQRLRRKSLPLEQLAHELRRRPRVATPLHEQVENLCLVVDRQPEPESSAADQNSHFVEMPLRRRPVTSAAKFPGEQRPVGLPKRVAELERKVQALEAASAAKAAAPAGKECPICGATMKVLGEFPHPTFDFAGHKIHQMKCEQCGHESQRDFTPGKGYL
jgi:hypothetical protein